MTTSSPREASEEWRLTSDAAELWHRAGPWLAEHPLENAPLLAEVAHLLATAPTADGLACGWWAAEDGTVRGAYVQAPRHSPLMTRMPRPAVHALAAVLPRPDGLGVPDVLADEAVAAWATVGHRLSRRAAFTVHVLDEPPPVPNGAGRARIAGPEDRTLLHGWFDRLMAGLPGDPSDRSYVVEDPLDTGALVLWEVDGEPVAMCSRSRVLADTVRMGACYAPGGDSDHVEAAFGAAVAEARRHARHVTVLAAAGDEREAARLAAAGFVPAATRVALTASGDC
ncbi:hypothetical protein [Nocardioides pinisoli]|uniref:GNAT family N-acetyltransferase n=1 Tax=Nocardioides pinisoli TaxID=2950279 RepID=A0ABT1KWW4_9ACTN|nr:hypothetical protein [Nocardioides pinisoli]MCP3421508.1 hypothetical protein [Nocardioides pinisoli]